MNEVYSKSIYRLECVLGWTMDELKTLHATKMRLRINLMAFGQPQESCPTLNMLRPQFVKRHASDLAAGAPIR